MRTTSTTSTWTGRRVLVRVDFNVPLEDGRRSPTTRGSAPRCRRSRICAAAARSLVLVSPPRAPEGPGSRRFSCALSPCASAELTGRRGGSARRTSSARGHGARVERLAPGGIVLCWRTCASSRARRRTTPSWRRRSRGLADVYVNDAFGSAHRAHASTEGVAHHVGEAVAGLLLEREVTHASGDPGGSGPARSSPCSAASKVTDKIAVIERFLRARRHDPDRRRDVLPVPQRAGPHGRRPRCASRRASSPRAARCELAASSRAELLLPVDLGLGERVAADARAARRWTASTSPTAGWGSTSARGPPPPTPRRSRPPARCSGTGRWGVFELDAVRRRHARGRRGGGRRARARRSSAAATRSRRCGSSAWTDAVTHLSTGGGAALELIEGKTLPGRRGASTRAQARR